MDKIITKVKGLPIWQQFVMLLVLIGIVVGGFLLLSGPKEVAKEILYQNLDPSEALTIEKEITKLGMQANLNEDSTIIYVDKTKIPQIKAHLATMGLPNSGDPGFELIGEGSITETNYDKQKKYERALVGDIQTGLIQGFNFIEKAVVQLNYRENESIFTSNEEESKASATIHTVNNKELTEEQVIAIKNFIASSVKNLDVKNVSIMDKNGITYGENGSVGSSAYSKQLQILSETEKRINDDIRKMLNTNFGQENVSIIVRADVDFDEIVQNIEKYDPTGTLISRQESNESIIKRDNGAINVVGTEANGEVPDYELEENNQQGIVLQQDSNDIIENFEVGKTLETIKKNPELTNVQVTVTINENLNVQNNDDFINEWQEIIANAAGIRVNAQGGFVNGNVKVSLQPFATINANEMVNEQDDELLAETQAMEDAKRTTMLIFIFVGVAMLLLSILAWFMHKRREEIVVTQQGDGNFGNFEEQPIMDENKERAEKLMNQIDKTKRENKWDSSEFTDEQKHLANEYRKAVQENPEVAKEYIKKLINEG